MTRRKTYLAGAVLPTVVVVALVMLTAMMGLLALWEQHMLLFERTQRLRQARADVESAATLYMLYPRQQALTAAQGYTLYDSVPRSRIFMRSEPWGLYELLHIATADSLVASCRIVGAKPDAAHTLHHADNRAAVTLAGDTRLQGVLHLPQNGIAYGRAGTDFYRGSTVPHTAIRRAEAAIAAPAARAAERIDSLFALHGRPPQPYEMPDSLGVSFRDTTLRLPLEAAEIVDCTLRGRIVLTADDLCIDSTCRIEHLLIAARKITVGRSARITAQLFARDTLIVEPHAEMQYPSGIYAGRYVELGDRATIDGYVIVRDRQQRKQPAPSYRQARTARVRGLLYVDGTAHVQGIVAGCAHIRQAACFTPQGYYTNTLCDLTLLENPATAQPLWLSGAETLHRKEVLCAE
ncbi:polymer-forming cytoskeletal protein [uncultured Alistipes sp.]|uniref:polymer-forming cytoskeletal protein n=1 Tax=uncultured Alistipes sp. TaxID=538949 RepID=UPI0026374909|nr:polymer-forming cytoskeletal protein [uncultured Alistipes sp.]